MPDYFVTDTAPAFAAACEALAAGTGPVAVDVERASGFRYSQRAYLVQVFRQDAGVFLFDPPAIGDFAPLQAAIGETEWVFHAASQDLPSLRELALDPPSIFDTELASRLLGHERVGLGAVVEETLGITLKKEHSAADWSTRPLPESWLEYAALDVLYLLDVEEILRRELREQGKTEFAEEEFAHTLAVQPKPPREEPWRRLRGLHSVRGGRNLAVARALWEARESYAREQDLAPGRLVPDRALVAAVLANPQSKSALAHVADFTGRASRSQLDRWWNAIVEGRASTLPPRERAAAHDTMPNHRSWPERFPEADARLKAARAAVEQRAEELHMPTENLLTPDFVRRLSWEPPATTPEAIGASLGELGARPWQIDETAQRIADAFVEAAQASAEGVPQDS